MTKKDYVNQLHIRRRHILRVLVGVLVCLTAAGVGLRTIIKGEHLYTAPQVANYLWDTPPTSFSAAELKRLIFQNRVSSSAYPWLLGVYWGAFLAFSSAGIAAPIFQIRARQKLRTPYARGLLVTYKLDEQLIEFERRRDKASLKKLRSAITYSTVASHVLPFKDHWLVKPQFDWFRLSSLKEEEHEICSNLAMLRGIMLKALAFRDPMRRFIEPIRILQDFFFAQAKRLDPDLFDPLQTQTSAAELANAERDILFRFVEAFKPLVAASKQHDLAKLPQHPDSFLGSMFKAPMVRQSMVISLVAGIVMAIGLFIFKISTSQAFLTWFTVTFGSLTISVGVTAVSVKSKDSRSEKQRLEE